MRPGIVRQPFLPLWLLRGFARGDAEAGETTWCYTSAEVNATRLRDAGVSATIPPHVAGSLAQTMAGGSRGLARAAQTLRAQPAGPAAVAPLPVARFVAWVALRIQVARTTIAVELVRQARAYLCGGQVGDGNPEALDAIADQLTHFTSEVLAILKSNRPAREGSLGGADGAADVRARHTRRENGRQPRRPVDPRLAGFEDFETTHRRLVACLCGADFRVVDVPAHSLILGDSAVLRWDDARAALTDLTLADPTLPSAVFLPIASSRLLVGTGIESTAPADITPPMLNRASARTAREFFVASANLPEFADLRPLILEAEGGKGGRPRGLGNVGEWLTEL